MSDRLPHPDVIHYDCQDAGCRAANNRAEGRDRLEAALRDLLAITADTAWWHDEGDLAPSLRAALRTAHHRARAALGEQGSAE